MTGKYIDLYEDVTAGGAGSKEYRLGVSDTLEWLDRNPAQVPGRTVTESELDLLVRGTPPYRDYATYAESIARQLGITVVADPEPTNAEKLKSKLRAFALEVCTSEAQLELARSSAPELAAWLDEQGVKAPGGDDDH